MRKILIGSLCILAACERTSLSPVEIKIDDGIGGFATVSSVNNTYTVGVGETLFDIANKFNIDPMNLAKVNDIKAPYNVRRGQILKLPIEDESNPSAETVNAQAKAMYMPVDIEAEKKSEKQMKELDDQFEKMMKADTKQLNSERKVQKPKPQNTERSKGFNEQAKEFSTPKVTSTATGSEIKKEAPKAEKVTSSKSSGKMTRPVDGKVVSKFGDNLDGAPNDGINIKAAAGTPVKSVSDGEVIYAGNNLDESFGNVVVVQHKDGLVSSYAHLKDIGIKKGAKVKAGQKIGAVGKTGDVSSPQLHLELMKDNVPVNPEKYLERN